MREIYRRENISIAVVSDMETGKKLPRIETLIKLMELVEMPYEELFSAELVENVEKFKTTKLEILLNLPRKVIDKLVKDYLEEECELDFPDEINY